MYLAFLISYADLCEAKGLLWLWIEPAGASILSSNAEIEHIEGLRFFTCCIKGSSGGQRKRFSRGRPSSYPPSYLILHSKVERASFSPTARSNEGR